MTLTLREKLAIDMTVLMRITQHLKMSDKQIIKIDVKYVKENYPQLSNEEAVEFLKNVAYHQLYVSPKIIDICKGNKK